MGPYLLLLLYTFLLFNIVGKYFDDDRTRTRDLMVLEATTLSAVSQPVCPDWAIYWTLGNFSKPFETINLSKSPTFLDNFCKGVKNFHFSSEIIFGILL